MKKNIYTYIAAATLFLTSCTDLDQSSISTIDKDNFYQNESDIKVALNGVYQVLTDGSMNGPWNDELIFLNDLQSEYARRGTANSAAITEIGDFAITPTNAFVETAWLYRYKAINRANILIEKVSNSQQLSAQVRNNYIGSAKFLRALYYFDLVRLFGDIPLVLHDGEGEGAPRTSKDEVYQQIAEDLTAAEAISVDFPKLSSEASSQAASGLLSKVYITWAQTDSEYSKAHQAELYQKAIEAANKVISSGRYKLMDKFIDNWSLDKKEGPELIFTVEHKFGVNRNVTGHCVFSTGFDNNKLPVIAAINNNLYYEFDAHDQRRDASVTLRLFDPSKGKYFDFDRLRFRKYIDTLYMANESAPYISGQNTSSSVLRYAEVLLVKAEAENELNGPTTSAYEALNAIRRRAYWNPYSSQQEKPSNGTPLELSGLSKEQFRQAVQDERYREFVTEGNRWFDLKRWHILVKTIKEKVPADDLKYKNISTRNYYLPVPETQIVLNPNLQQNWGYAGETTGDPYSALGWK
jgi:hypothetical protein